LRPRRQGECERALTSRAVHNIRGLSEGEVIARRASGQANIVPLHVGRSYLEIVRKNVFTFINTVLFLIGFVLVLMDHVGDAVVTAGLVLLNVAVGVTQEIRAKRKLDRIALLTRPKATVIRDAEEREVDPSEIVLGDVLVVRPGDQFVVDGRITAGGRVEVDESPLTGESERIRKATGDPVYSGSFCVSGMAIYEAEKVGGDCLVNQLAAGATAFRQIKTPLQREIDLIIRVLVLVVAQLGILLAISHAARGIPVVESVRAAAVVVALVPQGLFFMTTVSYAMGIVRVAGQGALIQETNGVESISNVNLLCMDKTGTLTTNRLQLHDLRPVAGERGIDERALRRILGDFGASVTIPNRTTLAISEALEGRGRRVREEVPFSSERKWSALAFDDPELAGVYVMGAPEVLGAHLASDAAAGALWERWTQEGLRVLLFAHWPGGTPLLDTRGDMHLPSPLTALGLVCFSDELRPEARETIGHFVDLGIDLKIFSGDNPQTVAALSRQVGVGQSAKVASGLDLDEMDDAQVQELVERTSIFGRVAPQQKERLVRLLRRGGHYVAMIGDGVNDVLSLKQAQVGVAMESGSQATRSVADIVLLGDSFRALPVAFREGQRILRGMGDVVRLLLTRTFYVLFLVVATQIVGVAFPVTPKHNSLIALLTVGIPIFAIAAWARPGPSPRSIIRSAIRFVMPASFSISVLALAVYLWYLAATGDVELARSALTTAAVLCGLVLIPFVEPPTGWWVGGDELSGDWRPTALALGMLTFYAGVLAVPSLRGFFELRLLPALDYAFIVLGVLVWALALRLIWRGRVFERLLEMA
jgi:cation-transporting ATPase E